MSFYLVNQPLNTRIYIPSQYIVFVSVLEIKACKTAVLTIDSISVLRLYDLKQGQVLLQVRLLLNKQSLLPLLNVVVCQNLTILISNKTFYFFDSTELGEQIDNIEHINQKQVKEIRIVKKSKDVSSSWMTLLNKEMKLIKKGQKIYMKLAGRNKKRFKYCFGIFNIQSCQLLIQHQWQDQLGFQFSMSLESLDNIFIIYQTYSNKGKPFKVIVGKYCGDEGQYLFMETTIIHFYQQITVNSVALLNEKIICIFGNNCGQNIKSSLMIVYNIQQKCTLNYLNFKQAMIEKVCWFLYPQYQFHQASSYLYFDAIQSGQISSLLYQLNSQSYQTDQNIKFDGKIIVTSKDFIFTRKEDKLLIYPKIHKRAIYLKWMNRLGVYDLQCLSLIVQLLQ